MEQETRHRLPDEVVDLSRRCRLMLEVTCQILRSDPELLLCEGLRLIEATRTAMARFAPERVEVFDSYLEPHMRSILFDRFGISQEPAAIVH